MNTTSNHEPEDGALRLGRDAVEQRIKALPGWSVERESICRQFTSSSFNRAIGFVVQIAILADAADHHPDIDIRYNRVLVTLSTHSAGGVTEMDFSLAARIDKAFAE